MRIRSFVVVAVVVTVAVAVGGLSGCSTCGGEVAAPGEGEGEGTAEGEGEPDGLVRLEVDPESLDLVVGEQEALTVVGREADGDAVDVGNQLSFASDDDNVASVDDAGNVVALSEGETRLVASVGSLTISVAVRVSAPEPPEQLEYTDIVAAAGQDIRALPVTDARGAVFTIEPALPPGLTFDSATGAIAGRVDVVVATTSFLVTAENIGGSVQNTLTIQIVCDPAIAVPPRDGDLPDLGFVDDNDDGIDGLACGPLFVSPDGNDAAAGTLEAPLLTLGTALLTAAAHVVAGGTGRDIYLAAGTYTGAVSLTADTSLYGGYDPATWARATVNTTLLSGGNPVVTGRDLTGSLELQLLRIEADDGFFAGAGSTGVLLENAGSVTLRRVDLRAGDGQDGARGVDGVDGEDGLDGEDGEAGCESSVGFCTPCATPLGGLGAFSLATGGSGGDGGDAAYGPDGGQDGRDGEGGSFGGFGGAGNPATNTARDGDAGDPGPDGEPGDNGSAGLSDGDGGDGRDAQDGEGGGGGGGGAGASNALCDDFGAAGGGGGSSGRGGSGGDGGTRGGASVGLRVVGTSVVGVRDSDVRAGTGGDGGDGGRGGNLGLGGFGGDGGIALTSTRETRGGNGGRGGDGGNGGEGGHGGGGGGGSSIALVVEDGATVDVDEDSALLRGAGGRGGDSAGAPGASGRVADRDDR